MPVVQAIRISASIIKLRGRALVAKSQVSQEKTGRMFSLSKSNKWLLAGCLFGIAGVESFDSGRWGFGLFFKVLAVGYLAVSVRNRRG